MESSSVGARSGTALAGFILRTKSSRMKKKLVAGDEGVVAGGVGLGKSPWSCYGCFGRVAHGFAHGFAF